ncbi:MAG TPA: ABC transporter substrate-binding protein [Ilumatobacteraceae bacterium]|jgi:glycine betaine/proline transport system substrate-binding protein
MKKRTMRTARWMMAGTLVLVAAACGSSSKPAAAPTTTVAAAATTATTAAPSATTAAPGTTTAAATGDTTAPIGTAVGAANGATTTCGANTSTLPMPAVPASGAGITLAVNPWTGSAVNANVAKYILETKLNTPTKLLAIDENATWQGLDKGDIDAVLEVWPSGHAADYTTYVTQKKSVTCIGLLGPDAKIGWYIPTFMLKDHPDLATWEGFKDPKNAKLFATAETGDLGQFLMGDPSYVSYDEQIIKNLDLPLKFVVAGSEAAEITAIQTAIKDQTPLLMQFWQPHWLQSKVALTQVKLPDVTPACLASAAANDGKYACDYPVDHLYKAASVKLQDKNPAAFAFLQRMQLTTDQQNEISALIDGNGTNGMTPDAAAKQWVDANPDIVASWLK